MQSFVSDGGKLSKEAVLKINGLTYAALMKALRKKDVKVNGLRINSDIRLNAGDRVEVYFVPSVSRRYEKLYSDKNLLVINKHAGITSEDLFEKLREEYKELYFIHRLDRNTSGVMLFAFNKSAEKELKDSFKNRRLDKIYRAVVYGIMPEKEGILKGYLIKDSEKALVKILDFPAPGAAAVKTGYRVVKEYENGTSLLEITLYTGKTHQIRAHLAHAGHFVIGDGKYGDNAVNRAFKVKTQMLAAVSITLHSDGGLLGYLDGKTFTCPAAFELNGN